MIDILSPSGKDLEMVFPLNSSTDKRSQVSPDEPTLVLVRLACNVTWFLVSSIGCCCCNYQIV